MKPQDLFLGVRDFLSLLVPGVVFLILCPAPILPALSKPLRIGSGNPDATLLVLVFLAAALTIGSILAGLAGLLDRPVDKYVGRRLNQQSSRWCPKSLAEQIEKLGEVQQMAAALARHINPIAGPSGRELPWTPRSFWWNYLRLNCPVATAELDRIEGLQKQFRSLIVVAAAAALFALGRSIRWEMLANTTGTPAHIGGALAPLADALPWFLALVSLVTGFFCFVAYVGYRVRFARRLFELAIIHALPKDTIAAGTSAFFAEAPHPAPTAPGATS
ncbi:hypothetical protein CA233_18840 [Sphingomonas sp. ABOLD]|jgi:hypothetical protein|uniref:Uncharacterized protein n=1 Tax=Sphingomonas trueperi TaxID=53317 RepID=A0A7X5Y1X6_9SPHN|nr:MULTISPECIES: hypothetical protein [Sphingomonas]NJB99581.1 hypothetical protein [Sphingomonas trueperi]RSV37955.1 hypothetical protein CA234_16720 [Sphingomonas sp. ABOLE]RSV41076.1 hypothetical protein CA233_18840 [Sphingomonas sp. ABOLD]